MSSISLAGLMLGFSLNRMRAPLSLASIFSTPMCSASNLSSVIWNRFLVTSGSRPEGKGQALFLASRCYVIQCSCKFDS